MKKLHIEWNILMLINWKLAEPFKKNGYGQYLQNLVKDSEIIKTKIKDLIILEPEIFGDNRGYFIESYNQKKFEDIVGKVLFVQDNSQNLQKVF